MSAFNSLLQQNACHRNIKWTFADLLPCYCYAINTNSRKNPLTTFAIRLCRQRRGHEWTASSSLHDTTTVNLTLVQCVFHTRKKLSLQESNNLIGIKMPTSGSSRNFWFIIPISTRGANARFPPCPAEAMPSLTILYQAP